MLFNKVVGQTKVKSDIIAMALANKVPHALLFLGPEGSGGLATALAFSQYLLCDTPTEQDSCGTCSSCQKAAKLIHPDLHFVFPVMGRNVVSDHFLPQWREAMQNPYLSSYDWLRSISGDKGSAQGNINKEECVSIVKKLSLKSFENKRKILLLWLPEYLQKEGNRLLKIIEEPPANTHFILVAENQELILNTILSRCQMIKFKPLSSEEIVQGLQDLALAQGPSAQSIGQYAFGNFNEAIKLAANQQKNNGSQFLDWLRKCYKGNGAELVTWSEQMAGWKKTDQKHFFSFGLHFLREYIMIKVTNQDSKRLGESENKTARKLLNIIGFQEIESLIEVFNTCSFELERNANPRLLFLDASIQLKEILRKESVKVNSQWQLANP